MVETADEEQSWIARSRAGDHEAFGALIMRYHKMIHALTYRMTGSTAEAEDLAQETFIAAFHQLASFRGESKFSSWLYRQREYCAAPDFEPPLDALSAQVQQALLQLNDKQRAAIVLTTYEGMNHAEAARVLGCSEATVSWRIFSARRKLKRWLEPLVKGRLS